MTFQYNNILSLLRQPFILVIFGLVRQGENEKGDLITIDSQALDELIKIIATVIP